MDWQKIIKENKQLLIVVTLVSVVFGSVAGVVVGGVAPVYVTPWWQANILGRQTGQGPLIQRPINGKLITLEEESATINSVDKVSRAVVSIIISKDISKVSNRSGSNIFPFEDFFEFGFPGFRFEAPRFEAPRGETSQPQESNKQEVGGGTGFFISKDGLILTNKHVVIDEEAEYSVLTNDGKRYDAKVLARDPFNDIAVVKIDIKEPVEVPELGDSDSLKMGQTVIAIGNSLGEYRNTVTKGVVSGLGRRVTAGDNFGRSEVLEEVIQTDAAINPGNSGGPLINLAGQVIGVNTAVNLQGQLIGFAIPINQAKQVIESVRNFGRIIRPFLGVRYALITETLAKKNNLTVDYGALIVRGDQGELAVTPGSPADKAGLAENDIILEFNGQKIDLEHPLAKLISRFKPGDSVELKVLSKGVEKKVQVKLEEFKEGTR